ncbi:hypothetical protein Ahy_A05g024270 isoform B [Arachis hypogaea]|uniref:Uncharacterized protein n=1 Tax=Arachis hypogaea TaxID=3818 RepID=A0A445D5H0_ARAHY|nr:hypothetical protein Ahy_A05g024270 isoform B [Arachis hypogaea]
MLIQRLNDANASEPELVERITETEGSVNGETKKEESQLKSGGRQDSYEEEAIELTAEGLDTIEAIDCVLGSSWSFLLGT